MLLDDGFESSQKGKGGRKNPKFKDHKETVLVTAAQAAENKKKKKQQNANMMSLYGGAQANEEEEKTASQATNQTDADAQDQERETKVRFDEPEKDDKKKKHQGKRGKKGGKGKGQQDSDEEEEKKSAKPTTQQTAQDQSQEEQKTSASQYPLSVIYCANCDVPPEYCHADKKDFTECVNWLKSTHPLLYEKIYSKDACSSWMPKFYPKMWAALFPEGQGTEAAEEVKAAGGGGGKKQKKKVAFGEDNSEVRIYKAVRRGKKLTCSITGLQAYGVNMKDLAKSMSKKFASSATHTTDDKYGECIQIQGDIEDRFFELMGAELAKYKIPEKKVVFEEVKKKKAAAQQEADGEEDDD